MAVPDWFASLWLMSRDQPRRCILVAHQDQVAISDLEWRRGMAPESILAVRQPETLCGGQPSGGRGAGRLIMLGMQERCRKERAACSQDGQRTNASCAVDTSLAGFILEFDRRPSFQRTPLATTSGPCVRSALDSRSTVIVLAGFVNCFQVVKVSEVG